jgi:processive 1,2-diacylglycerol beta-glucosyltransferase
VRQHRADNLPTSELTVRNFGIPISTKYLAPHDRGEARRKLGIDDGAVMVLLAGGGIGAGALGEVADSMLERTDWRVDVICGANRKMQDSLQDKYYPFKHINVHGYVDDIRDYYAASDVIALKPGGLSIAEAVTTGAAIMLIDPLPGQEQYNCDYLLEQGAALRIFENRRVGELISELLESRDELDRIRRRAKEISRPLAAKEILAFVTEKIEAYRAAKALEAEKKAAAEAQAVCDEQTNDGKTDEPAGDIADAVEEEEDDIEKDFVDDPDD